MSSHAISPHFELAPHATRSVAMAMALSLNLMLVVLALRPDTPIHPQTPAAALDTLFATLLPRQPAVVAPPPVTPPVEVRRTQPTLRVEAPPLTAPISNATAPSSVPVTATNTDPVTTAVVGDRVASVAYASASLPAYPVPAMRAGIEGTVLLKVRVGVDGTAVEVAIEKSSGSPQLDRAARKQVLAAWRFHPAMRDGRAVEAWALVPVVFKLNRY